MNRQTGKHKNNGRVVVSDDQTNRQTNKKITELCLEMNKQADKTKTMTY
jgi:hypothetical protein